MRVSISGFTPAHNGRGNRKNIIQVPRLLMDGIEDAGYTVDYGLEDADMHICYIFTLSSINSGECNDTFDTIRANPGKVILSMDDWRISSIYKDMEKVIKTKRFSKTHHTVDYKRVLENIDIMQDILDGKFKTLIPANKHGNHDLLEIKGDFTVYDPSVYVGKYRKKMEFDREHDLFPIHASLTDHMGYLRKKKYPFIQVQGVSEDYVWELYNKHRIVMSPPFYHNGSGWWRNRFSYANIAKAVIIEDEGGVFGEEYDIQRKDVTKESIDQLFEAQDKKYKSMIMSREEVVEALHEIGL